MAAHSRAPARWTGELREAAPERLANLVRPGFSLVKGVITASSRWCGTQIVKAYGGSAIMTCWRSNHRHRQIANDVPSAGCPLSRPWLAGCSSHWPGHKYSSGGRASFFFTERCSRRSFASVGFRAQAVPSRPPAFLGRLLKPPPSGPTQPGVKGMANPS